MEPEAIHLLHLFGHPMRLSIFRRLMAEPATLTGLAEALGVYPAKIRHHLKRLQDAGLLELHSTQKVRGFTAKYYTATKRAHWLNFAITPLSDSSEYIIIAGSHDPALERLITRFNQQSPDGKVVSLSIGSLDGLIALRQKVCHASGCHLYDPHLDQFNTPFIHTFFPEGGVDRIPLIQRTQGIILPPGNPLAVRTLEDVIERRVRFVMRNRGSGTQIWLERTLKAKGLAMPEETPGRVANTHNETVELIRQGKADAGLGLQSCAHEVSMDFIPLFTEPFDLVAYRHPGNKTLEKFLHFITSEQLTRAIEGLAGVSIAGERTKQ